MSKVYMLSAHFCGSDELWTTHIGFFTNKDIAEKVKEKWEEFFESSLSLFDEPVDFNIKTHGEDWTQTKEFDDIVANFQDILVYDQITLTEFSLNMECVIGNMYHNSDKLTGMMKQYDRDYKIENIIG